MLHNKATFGSRNASEGRFFLYCVFYKSKTCKPKTIHGIRFDEFVRQNKIVNEKTRIVVEPDMKASYILIDPNGWLLDNAANEMTPVEICDCRKEKLKEGLKKLTLDEKRYCNRYAL